MICRLLPLRLLRAAGGTRLSRLPPASAAVLCRFDSLDFTFSDSLINDSAGHRCFSARPETSTSGFGLRDHRRGDFKSRGTAGQAKSLIEDEEELSDWVSDLGKDSFRSGLCSNDEDSDAERSRNVKGRSRDGGVDRFRSRGGKGDSFRSSKDRPSSRMQWDDDDDDSDDFSSASGRGKFRDSRGGKGNSLRSTKGRAPSRKQWDDDSDGFSQSSGRRNSLSSKGRKDSSLRSMKDRPTSRRQWGDDFDGASSRGKTRNSRDFLTKRQLDSDLEDEDEDEEIGFSSRIKRDHGIRKETPSTLSTRGVREDVDLKFKPTRSSRRSVLLESDEESNEENEDDDDLYDDIFCDEDGKEVPINDVLKSLGSPEQDQGVNSQSVSKQSELGNDSYLSQTRFDQCSISPLTLRGVKAAGYERMTQVQEATLPVILQGKDVLAKAKTGTGKTVAFLLPAIEVVSKLPPVDRDQRKPPINVVIICPTRELAVQAGAEADKLVKFHPSIGVQVIMGGTRLALEQKRMQTNPCQILVATPGRFRDHIENTPGFATRLMGVKVLILDEADRLLDMGFRKDIEKIVAAVPKQRQTLLFSATVPDEVRQICYIAMKRELEFINTVEEGTEETHSQVRQMHLVAPLDAQFPLLYSLLTEHISDNVDYKVIVFCTTAMMTKLVADLLSELKLNVREMHSRKAQAYRTRVSKEFKESKGLILVSSDVSARGVDYPNVTLVIQLGVPADREQYIHRLGRTGRKGQEGTGILMLAPWEDFFLSSVKDLPITKASLPTVDLDIRKKVERALAHVEPRNKESAYQAWLGYYNSNKTIGRDKYQLVSLANEFSRSMGLDNPPALPKLILGKMGLNNVPGLRAK